MDKAELDQTLGRLRSKKNEWARVDLGRKIRYLHDCIAGTVAVAERQVASGLRAKGIDPASSIAGEEWLGGPVITVRNIRLLLRSLEEIRAHGAPRLKDGAVSTRPDGQVVVQVFPETAVDWLLFAGFSAEVWMQRDVTVKNVEESMAGFYRQGEPEGKVALVLGAGNVASIGSLDVVYKMFVQGRVCLLKLNPVNDYLGPLIEEAFAPLVEDGFLAIAHGGGDVGIYLCSHRDVDEIHITGSHKTHDAIVFGGGEEGAARRARGEPVNTKQITSELGNVSPVIVVPGPWSAADLKFHAENIATQMTNNAGFNCNAAKVLITHEGWDRRVALLDALRSTLSRVPPRQAYYPGASERLDRFTGAHSQAETFGERRGNVLPWTLIPGVDKEKTDDICFTTEAFCGVLAETALGGDDVREYLRRAVRFCNEVVWGTLNACVIVHPSTARDFGEALEGAIGELRYGSVGINHWPAICYGLGVTTWGAYPGHTVEDIQSGRGVVHNALMFDRPEKSVVRGPFRTFPKPLWFVTHRRMHKVAPRLLRYEANSSLLSVPGIIAQAVWG